MSGPYTAQIQRAIRDLQAGEFVWTGIQTFAQPLRGANGTAGAPTYSFTARPTDGLYDNGAGVSVAVGGAEQWGTFAGGTYVPTNAFVFYDGGSNTYQRFNGTTLSTFVGGVEVLALTAANPGIDFSGPITNLTVVKGIVTAAS